MPYLTDNEISLQSPVKPELNKPQACMLIGIQGNPFNPSIVVIFDPQFLLQ